MDHDRGRVGRPAPAVAAKWVDRYDVPTSNGRRLIKHPRYPVTLRLWVSYQPPYAQVKAGFYGLHL